MGVNRNYAKELHDNLGYLATWLPTANVQVGDVGFINHGVFDKKGNLKDYHIDFTSNTDPQTGDIEYASKDAVSIEVKASAATPVATGAVDADANVVVTFKRADAVLFQASGYKIVALANLHEVANRILDQYDVGDWPRELVVITDALVCDAATILISSGADAHIELATKAAVGTGQASLSKAELGFGAGRSSSIATKIVGARGTTPLFKAAGIKKHLFREPEVATRAAGDGHRLARLELIEYVSPPGELAG